MIRDLRFDEIERADRRKRLTRLIVGCLLLSSGLTFVVAREVAVKRQYAAIPEAEIGNLGSLRSRHEGIERLLAKHHFWTGAMHARDELDGLVRSIHEQERTLAKLEKERDVEETRIREEAEAARMRGNVFVAKNDHEMAIAQYRRALELADSLGEAGWPGGEWEHRTQVLVEIASLQQYRGETR